MKTIRDSEKALDMLAAWLRSGCETKLLASICRELSNAAEIASKEFVETKALVNDGNHRAAMEEVMLMLDLAAIERETEILISLRDQFSSHLESARNKCAAALKAVEAFVPDEFAAFSVHRATRAFEEALRHDPNSSFMGPTKPANDVSEIDD